MHDSVDDNLSNTLSNSDQRPHSDPGTLLSGFLALIAAVVFASGIILWQNLSEDSQYALIGEPVPETVISAEVSAPGMFGQFDLPARMFIRGKSMLAEHSEMVMSQFELAYEPEDQIRRIIMSGEFGGAESALSLIETTRLELKSRLDDVEVSENGRVVQGDGIVLEELDESGSAELSRLSIVFDELDSLGSIYSTGPDSIEESMRDQLLVRYGILGQAAVTHGIDDSDPRRQPIVNGFIWIALLMFGLIGLFVFGFLSGLVLLIIGIVRMFEGKLVMRCEKPAAGGSVFLETYAVFLLAFGVLSIGVFLLASKVNPMLGVLSLPLQWLLMVVPAWALMRGMKSPDWRRAIGLHSGEGVMKEIGCGVLAYLASVPLYAVGVGITFLIMILQGLVSMGSGSGGGDPEPMPTNPILEMLAGSGIVGALLILTLATIWAPITEELIFRGALYRHMRGRLHWILAALLTALLFAYMHSYGPLMVAPLIALGFMFAFMRQWRGSIIAPITAHFVHNATLVVFMILFVNLLKDPVFI
ncbi:MAG: lysostaphin resistance A-like protein [Phycisphaerales bacterium]